MCTVSFLPTPGGFRLAMNRDEKRARVAALGPELFQAGRRRAIYPREPGGGTWLAVNDAGLCLALINWHRIAREPAGEIQSRGRIIPELIGLTNSRAIARGLREMSLRDVRPFRLIALDSRGQTVTEWQWDLVALKSRRLRWERRHWFSSGYDEGEAERRRTEICQSHSLGSLSSLRELHASHVPRRGPFSICMHRPDAATVSYSEVVVTERQIRFRYRPGPPCREPGL
jgi:hypothetical protein